MCSVVRWNSLGHTHTHNWPLDTKAILFLTFNPEITQKNVQDLADVNHPTNVKILDFGLVRISSYCTVIHFCDVLFTTDKELPVVRVK